MPLLSKGLFLKKYNISESDFIKTKINWDSLSKIYDDYIGLVEDLESIAQAIVNKLNKAPKINSIKYRIKDPEHLIEKIIRKKIEEDKDIIFENYQELITDIIGIRVLHLFKEDWEIIHQYIIKEFSLIENPISYVREGDIPEYLDYFKKYNCEIKNHPFGYRSVHYLFESTIFRKKFITELQVRTVFEEGWSEVDHKIKYPYIKNNFILERFLNILNRFAGSADEMCSFILNLQLELQKNEKKIINLEEQIDKLKIDSTEKTQIKENIRGLDVTFINPNTLIKSNLFGIDLQKINDALASHVNVYNEANNVFEHSGIFKVANDALAIQANTYKEINNTLNNSGLLKVVKDVTATTSSLNNSLRGMNNDISKNINDPLNSLKLKKDEEEIK